MKNCVPLFVVASAFLLSTTLAASDVWAAVPPPMTEAAPQAERVLAPAATAWVSSQDVNANFGGRGYIWVGRGTGAGPYPGALRGLVRFDLGAIPAGATVTSALLYATIAEADGVDDAYFYDVGHAVNGWDKSTVTWSNRPTEAWGDATADIRASQGQISWDVTNLVRSWLGGSVTNYGFYLMREEDLENPLIHARMFHRLNLVVNHQPMFEITKTDLTDPVYAGGEVDYRIRVTNVSAEPQENVRILDVIPTDTTFVEATEGGTFDDGAVTWIYDSIDPGAYATVYVTLDTSSSLPGGHVLTNRASVSFCHGAGGIYCTVTKETSEETSIIGRLVVEPTPVHCLADEAGNTFEDAAEMPLIQLATATGIICPVEDEDWYKFPVEDGQAVVASIQQLTADLGLQLVSPTGQVIDTADQSGLANEFVRTIARTRGVWRARVQPHSSAAVRGSYRLLVLVRDVRQMTTPEPGPPALEVETWLQEDELVPGETAHYHVLVRSSGQSTAHNVRVRNGLPNLTTFIAADPAGEYQASPDHRVRWDVGDLEPGAIRPFVVTVTVNEEAASRPTLRNQANASADDVDNVHAESVDPVAAADVTVSPWTVTSPVVSGEEIHVRASVCNEGGAPAANVVVTAQLTSDFHTVETPGGDFDRFANTIEWTFDAIAAGTCQDGEFTATLSSVLTPTTRLHVDWSVVVDGTAVGDVDQTIIIDSQHLPPDVEMSWELSGQRTTVYGLSWLTATVQVEGSRVDNLWLTFEASNYLSVFGKHRDCDYDGTNTSRVLCPLSGEPGEYVRHVRLQVAGDYADEGLWVRMTVQGDDMPSTMQTADLTVLSDVTIDGLEITQSIQRYPQNNVRLIQGRKTWIRVYPLSNPGPTDGVDCDLRVYRCNGGDCSQYLDTLEPLPIEDPSIPVRVIRSSFDRGDGNQSFIFGLYQDWAEGTLALVPEINPGCRVPESNCSNNVGETVYAEFTGHPSLVYRRMDGYYTDHLDNEYEAPADAIDGHVDYVRGALPYAAFTGGGPTSPGRIPIDSFDFTTDEGWSAALSELISLHDDCSGSSRCGAQWVLVLPPFPAGYGDLAWGGIASGYRDIIMAAATAKQETLAHELGHNHDIGHADCPPAGDPDAPDIVDRTIPVHIEDYGFSAETLYVYNPNTIYDLMSYCPGRWPSIDVYDRFIDQPPDEGFEWRPFAADAPQPGLLVAGRLDLEKGTGAIGRAALRSWPGGPFDHAGAGPYSLELRRADGSVLFTRHFSPTLSMPITAGAPAVVTTSGSFHEILTPQPGASRIVLLHGADTLDTRIVSANAPEVTLLAPNGGETIDAPFEARWRATDADGDPLTYGLQISRDGGQGWLPVASALTGTTFMLDPEDLPGANRALLRITANDGVRTAMDTSDGSFTVPNHPPEVRITKPDDGARVRAGQPLYLAAEAWDVEDDEIGEQLAWRSDVDGDLGTGLEIGLRTLSARTHTITASVTDGGGLSASDSIRLAVVPAAAPPEQCSEALTNGDFEQPAGRGWIHAGKPGPAVVTIDRPTDTHAVLLGNPGRPDEPGLSAVRQTVHLREGTATARLSFRYRVDSDGPGEDYDWFIAAVTDGDGKLRRVLRRHGGRSDWETVTADLSAYSGQAIGIQFAVRNDGQAGRTWALVDDVSLCVTSAEPLLSPPTGCWLGGGLTDYAPTGLPDFDQRQRTWQVPDTEQWSHDGPAAMADLLWWRDAVEEPRGTAPPDQSDGYPLVAAYGPWDDHDPRNVVPLITNLATRFGTNADRPGTDLGRLASRLQGYVAAHDLANDYSVDLRKTPSFDWVRGEVRQNRQVLMLLGFWEMQPSGLRRLGGHYVGVAGVGCEGDRIALSDPWRDGAETGGAGLAQPHAAHGHPAGPPDAVHNDAAAVSHDVYGIMRMPGVWGPQGYATGFSDIDNFMGLNFTPSLEEARAGTYLGGTVLTVVDYALVLAPRSPLVTLKLSPADASVTGGAVFNVELDVMTGQDRADHVAAYLDFDPDALQVVDERGGPAAGVIPGTVLGTVVTNRVDNAAGRIDFVASGNPVDGRFTAAVVRFRAITGTGTTALVWSADAPRQTDVTLDGQSLLEHPEAGSVTLLPGARLTGRLALQGRPNPPDPSWRVPLLLTLNRPGERGPAYAFGTVSAQGAAFALPGVVAPGDYRLRVKGIHTLRNLIPTSLTAGSNTVNVGTLLEGDAYADNRVAVRDVSLLTAAYGKSQGEDGFDPRADFNEDDSVDDGDAALLRANLGRRGDILVESAGDGAAGAAAAAGPAMRAIGANLRPNSGPAAVTVPLTRTVIPGDVTVSIVPTNTVVTAGGLIDLEVIADADEQVVDAAAIFLDYDPKALAAVAVRPGTALASVFRSDVSQDVGWIDLVVSSLGSPPASGRFSIARMRFRVLSAGTHWVRFSFAEGRTTQLVRRGEPMLGRVEAARVQATGYVVYLPAAERGHTHAAPTAISRRTAAAQMEIARPE